MDEKLVKTDRAERWVEMVRGLPDEMAEALSLFPIEAKVGGAWRQTVILGLVSGLDGETLLEVAVPDSEGRPPMPGLRKHKVSARDTRPIGIMQEKMYEFLQALLIAEVSQPLRKEDPQGEGWRLCVAKELAAWVEEFDQGIHGRKLVFGGEHEMLAGVVERLRLRQEHYGVFYHMAVLGVENGEVGEPVVIFTDEPLEGRVRLSQEYLIGRSQGGVVLTKEPGKRLWPVGIDPEWTGVFLLPAWIGLIARFDAILEEVGDPPAERAGQPIMQWLLREFAEAGKDWDQLAEKGVPVPAVRREWLAPGMWGLSEEQVDL